MKELSIEEKAKAYDEALERAKEQSSKYCLDKIVLEDIFPELKESEDERVRNKLIEFFKGYSPDKEWWGNITQEDILAWLEKQGEQKPNCCDGQKPAWSEEDEKILNLIIARLHSHPNVEVEEYGKDYHWLNSLENRVQPQPKQEWSLKEDALIQVCVNAINDISYFRSEDKEKVINWLKSLKPKNRWKPSESDIRILEQVIGGTVNPINYHATLYAILEQLKKL